MGFLTGLIELELLHSNQLGDQLQLSTLRSLEVMLATLHITICMHDCTGRAYSWSPFWTWHLYAHYIALCIQMGQFTACKAEESRHWQVDFSRVIDSINKVRTKPVMS